MKNNVFIAKILTVLVLILCAMPIAVYAADTVKPNVYVSGITSGLNVDEGGSISLTVRFQDAVEMGTSSLSTSNFVLNGFTASVSISRTGTTKTVHTYSVTLSNIQGSAGSGKYVTVLAGAATDTASNATVAVNSNSFNLVKKTVDDTVRPTVSITGITSGMTKKVGETVTLTITVQDAVSLATSSLSDTYFVLNGFTASKSITRTSTTATTHIYSVVLSNIQGSVGSGKSVTVLAGAGKDTAGNTSNQVTSNNFSIVEDTVVDKIRPVTTVTGVTVGMTKIIGDSLTLTVTFTDETAMGTSNLVANNITLNGFTATKSIVKNSADTKSHVYTVTLTNIQGSIGSGKSVTITEGVAKDVAGNTSTSATSLTFTLNAANVQDTVRPNAYITGIKSGDELKRGDTLVLTVRIEDAVALATSNLSSDTLVLNGFTASTSIVRKTTTDKVHEYTVTLTNIQGTLGNNKTITLKSGVGKDIAGNTTLQVVSNGFVLNEASNADTVRPNVYITGITSGMEVTLGNKLVLTVRCEDAVGLASSDISKNTLVLNGFTADISSVRTSTTNKVHIYTVTLTNIQGSIGSGKYVTVKADSAVDTSGNKSLQVNSNSFTLIKKIEPPVVSNPPTISIGNANPSAVYAGGKVVYIVTFADDVAVTEINLTSKDITLNGFTATVTVSGSGLKTRTVTLSNIQGSAGYGKSITIAKGVAKDADGNVTKSATSPKFSILQVYTPITVVTVSTCGCIDDLKLLGDLNKEITYFSSWLRAEKYTATYVQENNYVAKDETMTYMVEYYNGSTAPAPEVSFRLTIPYYVEIEEVNGCGYLVSRNENETIIGWDVGKVPSGAYCRVFVRVRFTQNTKLEKSSNISETFYATLKTIAGGNTSYSYMRQLFIDKTSGKTGTFTSYLSTLDASNSIRPEDEITRAEFAKLLADCGIVTVNNSSTAYKTFKDWEEIPVYARSAVAALVEADIIQAFSDGKFKPGNPILMEDAIQMVAQAAVYMSNSKLTVVKPTFLYTDALLDRYKELSEKKDYIMELMRQNVIVKYDCDPDKYALRKDIVTMVNALTFRGPYVEKLPQNTMKFADIRDDSVYFYDFVGASNTYTYVYDYRLWQEITSVNN